MKIISFTLHSCCLSILLLICFRNNQDPCLAARLVADKLSNLAATKVFAEAKNNLALAATDNNEHGLVFGKDSTGKDIISPVRTASLKNASPVDLTFPQAFADMHNHPGNSVPSAGDIYNLIQVNRQHPVFYGRITVLSNGTIYAIAVVDTLKASGFVKRYPPEQTKGFSPRFPPKLFNEFAELKSYLINISGIEKMLADEMATAWILERYDAGVVLLRLNPLLHFQRVFITEEISSNGDRSYHHNVCALRDL